MPSRPHPLTSMCRIRQAPPARRAVKVAILQKSPWCPARRLPGGASLCFEKGRLCLGLGRVFCLRGPHTDTDALAVAQKGPAFLVPDGVASRPHAPRSECVAPGPAAPGGSCWPGSPCGSVPAAGSGADAVWSAVFTAAQCSCCWHFCLSALVWSGPCGCPGARGTWLVS